MAYYRKLVKTLSMSSTNRPKRLLMEHNLSTFHNGDVIELLSSSCSTEAADETCRAEKEKSLPNTSAGRLEKRSNIYGCALHEGSLTASVDITARRLRANRCYRRRTTRAPIVHMAMGMNEDESDVQACSRASLNTSRDFLPHSSTLRALRMPLRVSVSLHDRPRSELEGPLEESYIGWIAHDYLSIEIALKNCSLRARLPQTFL